MISPKVVISQLLTIEAITNKSTKIAPIQNHSWLRNVCTLESWWAKEALFGS